MVASVSEERFFRVKTDCGWPPLSIKYCLHVGGASRDLDQVARAIINLDPVEVRVKRSSNYCISDYIRENEEYWKPRLIEKRDVDFYDFV